MTEPRMEPHFLGVSGKMAMELHNYPDAIQLFSKGLALLESLNLPRQFAAPFLMDRAECYWQLGNVEVALQEMEEAWQHGLRRDEKESIKWSERGFSLLEKKEYSKAERCANFALYFQALPRTSAQASLCKAIARYEMEDITGATAELKTIEPFNVDQAKFKLYAQKRKNIAISNMHNKEYQRSIKDFNFALLLYPNDGSKVKFKRSVESHQANLYFRSKHYNKAVELGEQSFNTDPHYKCKDEAKRWKDRGNNLLNDAHLVDLAISCYSLALKFIPANEEDFKAKLFSNRSLMYKKQGKAEEALMDAQNCVKNDPEWPKAHYRLGSCFLAQKEYMNAMEPFSTSLKLLLDSDSRWSKSDAIDTLSQLLSIALKLPDGTSSIQYDIPKTYIETVINKAVSDEDWATLHLLYLGGGGPKQFKKGSGGLADGCDASSVPLTKIISCDFPDLGKFVSVLLDHRAHGSPLKEGKTARELAIDLNKLDVASVLMDKSNISGQLGGVQLEGKCEDAKKAMEEGDNSKAIKLFQHYLTQEGNTVEEQRETLQTLCKLYFREKAFEDCLRTGNKLKKAYPKGYQNEDKATQWKNWGNELNKERKYYLMAEYYTLALEFTPTTKIELMGCLLSNRCLALKNLNKFEKALKDAKECTTIRPKWFRVKN